MFSAALCRGLIEAGFVPIPSTSLPNRFPRLYAAASLKRHQHPFPDMTSGLRFPRLYAAASLKPIYATSHVTRLLRVFRGFMPRPH